MHERQGWLSTTLRVELCQGSAFLPQRLHPASVVQEKRALQRAMFAAGWHGCRRDQVDVSGEARIRAPFVRTFCRDQTMGNHLDFHSRMAVKSGNHGPAS